MFNKLALGLLLSSGLAVFSASAQSLTNIQTSSGTSSAYAQDGRGAVTRSGAGLCWRTGYWTPGDAVEGCDGELVSPMAHPTAPDLLPSTARTSDTAPLVAVEPVRRCDFNITLSTDGAFPFGKATLSAKAGARLEREFREGIARCGQVEAIQVTGHTDRLGSPAANQRLSEQRAAAVAARLGPVTAGTRVEVTGAGSSESTSSCSADLDRQRLIYCLSADRRATVNVRGKVK